MGNDLQTWGASGAQLALQQVARSVESRLGLHVEASGDAFTATAPASPDFAGPDSLRARIADGVMEIEVTLPAARGRGPMDLPFRYLEKLDQKVRPRLVEDHPRLDLRIDAAPLDPVRLTKLEQQFAVIAEFSAALRAEAPAHEHRADLETLYEGIKEIAEPVTPLAPASLSEQVRETLDPAAQYLRAGTSVALATASRIQQQYAEAALAAVLPGYGIPTLGRLRIPGLSPKGLIEIRTKSPGPLAVHASQMMNGTSRYERDEWRPALELLSVRGEGTLFSGAYEELSQAFVFQGTRPAPTLPAIIVIPAGMAPLSDLCRFAVLRASAGQVPAKTVADLAGELQRTLADLPQGGAERILPELARNAVLNWSGAAPVPSAGLAQSLLSLKQTFAGAPPPAVVARDAGLQERLIGRLLDPALTAYLKASLAGQEGAIDELVRRLRAEVLGRPLHQPLRWASLGPPAVGKSESARLIAEWIGVPYESVDLGSFADSYTANAQLRGSGRGLVGSNEMGRLESLSKIHGGVVVEFADLDHAPVNVRAQLADLCLQVLDKGAFETANGATCSSANLIIPFTLNLPGGRDERLFREMGFQQGSVRTQPVHRAIEELKPIVSSAFLSRVGTPILFGPLDAGALALILERAVRHALDTACERLGAPVPAWRMPERLGERLLALAPGHTASLGARGLAEHARAYAAEAAAGAIALLRTAPPEARILLDESARRLEIKE
jgi:hypothetical protein